MEEKCRRAAEQMAAEAKEFLDPYTDRTYVDEPGSTRVIMQPGKMLDKLRERMEQVVLDPSNIEVAVEGFLSFDEVMMLVSARLWRCAGRGDRGVRRRFA